MKMQVALTTLDADIQSPQTGEQSPASWQHAAGKPQRPMNQITIAPPPPGTPIGTFTFDEAFARTPIDLEDETAAACQDLA